MVWQASNIVQGNLLFVLLPLVILIFAKSGFLAFIALFMGNLAYYEFVRISEELRPVYNIFKAYYFDLFLIGLLPFVRWSYVISRIRKIDKRVFMLAAAFFIYTVYMMTAFDEVNVFQLVMFYRSYFKYAIVFFFLASLSAPKLNRTREWFIKWFVIVVSIQFTLSLIQSVILQTGIDSRGGLLGSHLLFPIGMIYLGNMYHKHRLTRHFTLAVVILLFIFGMAETKSGLFLTLPFIVYLIFVVDGKRFSGRWTYIVFIGLIFIGSIVYVIPKVSDQNPSQYFQTAWYQGDYFYHAERGRPYGRIAALKVSFDLIGASTQDFLFGYGPGSASPVFIHEYDGYLKRNLVLLGDLYVSVLILIVETGIVGFTMLYLLMFFLARSALRQYRVKNVFYYMSAACFFAFLISPVFHPSWRLSLYNYLFWFFIGISFNEHINNDSVRTEKQLG